MHIRSILWFSFVVGILGLTPAGADTVRLKDGSKLEGEILSETSSNLTIEVEMARGTITRTQTIARDQIDSIKRPTAAERAEKEMNRAFDAAEKCRLDPLRSFELAYYDKTLDGVFRRFLADYPNSPKVSRIQEKIAEWQAERDKVAGGQGKYQGRWMSLEEAQRLQEDERVRQTLDRVQEDMSRGNYEKASNNASALAATVRVPKLQMEINHLQAEIFIAWQRSLEDKLRAADDETHAAEHRVSMAQESLTRSESSMKTFLETNPRGILGYQGLQNQHQGAIQRAQVELNSSQTRVGEMRDLATALREKLAQVQSRSAELGTPVGVSSAARTSALSSPEAEKPPAEKPLVLESDLLANIWTWLGQNWIYLAVGILAGLWLLSRAYR